MGVLFSEEISLYCHSGLGEGSPWEKSFLMYKSNFNPSRLLLLIEGSGRQQ